jgi:NAD+ kinase
MKIAIFGKSFNPNYSSTVQLLFHLLNQRKVDLFIYKPFFEILQKQGIPKFSYTDTFDTSENIQKDVDFLICIGGDGTMLEAITYVKESGIPLIGINSGRLGFLANISEQEAEHAIQHLLDGDYQIEERSMLKFNSEQEISLGVPYAYNECTIQKDGSSLITIHVNINGEYLTSYWADGLIIATPTGSTAYSLSVGGPIVSPDSKVFIISPIAAHNLNVRPLVIPDSSVLTLSIEGRTSKFLVSLDSRSTDCDISNKITISKADFSVKMIKLHSINFYATLRNKMMWGHDKRN